MHNIVTIMTNSAKKHSGWSENRNDCHFKLKCTLPEIANSLMSQFSFAHIQTLSQTFYSPPIVFTKDQSVFFFCSLSVDTSSLREHNYQHRTITPFPVKMRQFPAPDSFHALTIPPGIMAHKEPKPTSGFVIFLLLSVKEFRTSFYFRQHSIHLSIRHLLFLFNIYFFLIT